MFYKDLFITGLLSVKANIREVWFAYYTQDNKQLILLAWVNHLAPV